MVDIITKHLIAKKYEKIQNIGVMFAFEQNNTINYSFKQAETSIEIWISTKLCSNIPIPNTNRNCHFFNDNQGIFHEFYFNFWFNLLFNCKACVTAVFAVTHALQLSYGRCTQNCKYRKYRVTEFRHCERGLDCSKEDAPIWHQISL